MGSIEENAKYWGENYNWPMQGDEWSKMWGSSEVEWQGTILPRIASYVPAENIVEIAPGYGRWTDFLKEYGGKLIAIDLSKSCVDACKKRFGESSALEFRVNDGKTLIGIPDSSIHFVFSFDSLVHVEKDAMGSYIEEIARVLIPGGVAFLHHSNPAEYPNFVKIAGIVGKTIGRIFPRLQASALTKWRAPSVSAAWVKEKASASGLSCVRQELVNWEGALLTDAFTTLAKGEVGGQSKMYRNPNLMKEASLLKELDKKYREVGVSLCRRGPGK